MVERAFSAHDPGVYPGKALLILHEDDTALYTDNPVQSWAALAEEIDVTVLPGGGHAMLEEPGSARLAALLNEHLSSVP